MTSPTVPIIGPDGKAYDIPYENMHSALSEGGKMGVYVEGPDKKQYVIPADRVNDAVKDGGKVIPYNLDQSHQKEGFWSSFGSTLKGMVTPQGQNPYPGMGQEEKMAAAEQAKSLDTQRKEEGRGLAYRAAAPIAGLVADVPGMEQSAREGDTAGVLGHAVGSAAPVVAGEVIGAAAPKVGAAIESKLGRSAPEWYRSALKPTSVPSQQGKVAAGIKTGLEEGIPVSEAGIEKLSALIDDVNRNIKSKVAGSSATVNKFKVANRLYDTADTFKNQVNPTGDLQAISESGKEFVRNNPTEIPVQDAQAMKSGTYRQLKGKAYGELKGASIEAQKALARGLKEEISEAIPELKELNAKDSKLLNLDPLLERAVARVANRDVGGISTPITAGVAKTLTQSKKAAMAAGAIKAVIDNPSIKSRLAIAMYRASKGNISPALAQSRLAAYSAALARAANTQPPDDQQQQ